MSETARLPLVDAAPSGRDEPDWLASLRRDAYQYLLQRGLPTSRDEEWKYTKLRALAQRRFATQPDKTDAAEVEPLEEDHLAHVSVVNGEVRSNRPAPGLALHVYAAREIPDDLRPGALADFAAYPMAALNSAYFQDLIVVEVGENQVFEQPLLLEFVSAPGTERLLCPRVLLRLGQNSRLTVVERFAGLADAANLTVAVTEASLDSGARLDHYRLQELAADDVGICLMRNRQLRDSVFNSHVIDIGAKLHRADLYTELAEPGAAAMLSGFYLALDRQHTDNHTRIDHLAPHTRSEEIYHGVLGGRARAVFNGKVLVAADAQKTVAHQSNRNLLLEGTAEIDTKPELEIYADDVRCSHGATVGQLDQQALFYLRSRGIGDRTARALLTFAFAEQVLARYELESLSNYIEQQIAARLPDHERLEALV